MNKRLALLEQMTQSGKADSFAWYGLAMEYKKENRIDAALGAFQELRGRFPDYVPQYLMCGQMLLDEARAPEARGWLEAGVALARSRGESKALSELESALALCD
jgi:predicted Zn-dependent protease